MKSASAANLASDLLQRWLKSVNLFAGIIHVSIKLVPKVQLPNLMAQGKDNSWREQ
jgi:hypothetical protein